MRGVAFVALALLAPMLLAGCEELGIESAATIAAKREAEGKAVGAGCRHAGRSIEQCFQLNRRADKAAVFAGWREMEDYMRENNIAAVPPPPEPTPAQGEASGGATEAKAEARAPGEPKPEGG
jgi:hypothetical protein